jgi:alpha-N-arabinofuranosidase
MSLTARHARGDVVLVSLTGPDLETTKYGPVPSVDAAATLDEAGALAVFVVNRNPDEPVELSIYFGSNAPASLIEELVLADPDPRAVNTRLDPERVVPRRGMGATISGARLTTTLEPASWTMLRVEPVRS